MTSILTAVFKFTIGLLVNKGRDKAAESLKEGDVTDQKFRGMIVREIEDIKLKLDALSRKDLLASFDFFEARLRYLYKAVDAKRTAEANAVNEGAIGGISPSPDAVNTVSLASEMGNMQLTEHDGKSKTAFSQAKERFTIAREKATEASNNEALSTFDRITAIRYRVMATMLESAAEIMATARDLSCVSVESALENALPECEQCLKKLHSLPAVHNSFKVEFQTGWNLRGRFGKDERMEIISTVCQVNRAVYDAMHTVNKHVNVWIWPFVDTAEDKVDPLRDGRVTKVLRKVGMESCCVKSWSFGQEGQKEHKLIVPSGIATNTQDQVLIADYGDQTIKAFDIQGNFILSFNPQTYDANRQLIVFDVATDMENNNYVLVKVQPRSLGLQEVRVFNNTAELRYKFPVRTGHSRLSVSCRKVLVLSHISWDKDMVYVYEHNGRFICTFGEGVFTTATDITSSDDGRVMVMDIGDPCVHLFTVEGQQLFKFNINIHEDLYYRIKCHPAGEHVIIAGTERGTGLLRVAVFTTTGQFVRRIQLDEEKVDFGQKIAGITVTKEDYIHVAVNDAYRIHSRVIVV